MSWAENKVVLVTGSSSGIGKQVAIHFARLGSRVVITGRDAQRVEDAAKECNSVALNGYKSLGLVADITSRESLKMLVDTTIRHFGQLDVLVNNAGMTKRVDGTSDPKLMDTYDEIFATNVSAPLYLCHLAAPHLEVTKGVIINVSSIAAFVPSRTSMLYCMSKSTVDTMTQCLALDLGPRGIRVNCISPGLVETPLIEKLGYKGKDAEEFICKRAKSSPIGRIGDVEDCAELIAFLASPQASWITGTNVKLDGGNSLYR